VCTNCGDIEVLNPRRGAGTCPNCGCKSEYKTIASCSKSFDDKGKYSYVQSHESGIIARIFEVSRYYNIGKIKLGELELNAANVEIKTTHRELGREFMECSGDGARHQRRFYWGNFANTNEIRWCEDKGDYIKNDIDLHYDLRYNLGLRSDNWNGWIYPHNINNIFVRHFKSNIDVEAIVRKAPHDVYLFVHKALSPDFAFLENFAKAGLNNLTKAFMKYSGIYSHNGKYWDGFSLPNKTATSPKDALAVTKCELDYFRKVDITPSQYRFFAEYRKNNKVDYEVLDRLFALQGLSDFDFTTILQYTTLHRIIRYLTEQRKNYDKQTSYNDIVTDWNDYIGECKTLKYNLGDTMILCPRNLPETHRAAGVLIETGSYKKYNKGIVARYKVLRELEYESKKFVIFPFRNSDDFVIESNLLSHCIRNYAQNHSQGHTNVFACRLKSTPEQSYFTVQVDNNGRLQQNRGKKNCSAPADVEKFVKSWISKVVKPKAKLFNQKKAI
jgi:hypothetical protein